MRFVIGYPPFLLSATSPGIMCVGPICPGGRCEYV
nr:MAG TPA: hypothetical protein [Caudoviricetes sp.]